LVVFFFATAFDVVRLNLGLIFYVWVGVFNMMVVAQFWAFCNDLCNEEQGRRLFPLLGFGQTVGAAAGSGISLLLLKALGTYTMLLVAAGMLALSAFLTHAAYAKGFGNASPKEVLSSKAAEKKDEPKKGVTHGAFRLVFSTRYLTLIALFSLLFTLVNSNGEFMLGKLFKAAADAAVAAGKLPAAQTKEYLGERYSEFFLAVNILTMLLQGFVVSRVVKWGGLRVAFMVLPVIALFDAAAVAVLPVLAILRVGKVFENSADYSFNNTARNLLWLRTTTEMKYKAKQAIDTFFVRMGDVTSALCVYVGASLIGLGVRGFAVLNLVLIALWLWLAWAIIRENKRLHTESEAKEPAT
jgi:AAA family ATP:ADP antiporter